MISNYCVTAAPVTSILCVLVLSLYYENAKLFGGRYGTIMDLRKSKPTKTDRLGFSSLFAFA